MIAPRRGLPTLLLVVGTTFWGMASAVLAVRGTADGSGAPLLAAGGSLGLFTIVLAGPGRRQLVALVRARRQVGAFAMIGALEGINLGLYAAALSLGPAPVVVSLHLTSPLILLGVAVLRRRRRPTPLMLVQVLLISGGIALLGADSDGATGQQPLLAGVLALGSAVAVAGLITAVTRLAPSAHPDVASAVQLGLAALATAPIVLAAPTPDPGDSAALLVAGALFLGPGFAIAWRALRHLTAVTAGIIGLNEAVATTVFLVLLFGETVSVIDVLSGALILAAVLIETLGAGRPLPRTQARLPDEVD